MKSDNDTSIFYEEDGSPKLYLMAYCGQAELLEKAIAKGHKLEDGNLHDAACGRPCLRGYFHEGHYQNWPSGFRDTVRLLIANGTEVNARNAEGGEKYEGCKPWVTHRETPLHYAAAAWDIDIVKQLLDAGADRTLENDLHETPFDWAVAYAAPMDVVELLDFESNPRRNSELVDASHSGDLDKVTEMIECGADPNACDANGMGTLLTFHPKVMKYLLEQGAKPNLQRNESTAPVLSGIIYQGNIDCARLLIEAGADVNRQNEYNHETALHIAVAGDNTEMVKLLLDSGADLWAQTKPRMATQVLWRDARVRGETALHRAAAWGSAEVIQLLLDAGAEPSKIDINKDTPLSYASWHQRDKSIIDMLAYEGAGVGPSLMISGKPVFTDIDS